VQDLAEQGFIVHHLQLVALVLLHMSPAPDYLIYVPSAVAAGPPVLFIAIMCVLAVEAQHMAVTLTCKAAARGIKIGVAVIIWLQVVPHRLVVVNLIYTTSNAVRTCLAGTTGFTPVEVVRE